MDIRELGRDGVVAANQFTARVLVPVVAVVLGSSFGGFSGDCLHRLQDRCFVLA